MIRDITVLKRNVCATAGTSAGKSLVYQAIPALTSGAVLVVFPTIALMHDQCESIRKTGLTVAALTPVAIAEDPNLWRRVDQGKYDIVLASPEVLLANWSWFWQKTVQAREGVFAKRLRYIVVDEAHLIWGWRGFRNEYRNLGHLKDVFPVLPTLILSATVTPSILEYIRVSLKISGPSRIHRESLDRLNFTYMVMPIQKPKYNELAFLVRSGPVGNIPKTLIYVNIDEAGDIVKFLKTKLSERIRDSEDVNVVIRDFSSNLEENTRYRHMAALRSGDTRIWVARSALAWVLTYPISPESSNGKFRATSHCRV